MCNDLRRWILTVKTRVLFVEYALQGVMCTVKAELIHVIKEEMQALDRPRRIQFARQLPAANLHQCAFKADGLRVYCIAEASARTRVGGIQLLEFSLEKTIPIIPAMRRPCHIECKEARLRLESLRHYHSCFSVTHSLCSSCPLPHKFQIRHRSSPFLT